MGLRISAAALAVSLLVAIVPAAASGDTEPIGAVAPVNTVPPAATGDPTYREVLRADPGEWMSDSGDADGLTYTYQWLRDDRRIRSATGRRHRAGLDDVGHRLSVRVVATDEAGESASATSEPTSRVARAVLDNRERPGLSGTARYTRVLTADPGRWSSPRRPAVRYRWLRGGEPIAGATGRRYRLQHTDVGRRVRVEVRATAPGYRPATALSTPRRIAHRVPLRRTVTYRIATRGRVVADVGTFRRQVAETFADPRGWRSGGVGFRRVARGGAFTVVLAQASTLPSYSSVCSVQWSCRVGRNVVINQDRWRWASPAWNRANRPLREYRHMVVNHETGHWLGHGHLGCGGRGKLAPVMMQQSKGLDGCRHNPWPLPSELR